MSLETIAISVNTFVALGCGVFLLIKLRSRQTRNASTLFWTIGFFVWSLQLALRMVFPFTSTEIFLLAFTLIFFLLQGAIFLLPKQLVASLGYLPVMLILIIVHFEFGYDLLPLLVVFLFMFSYGVCIFGSLGRRLGGDANWLALGWVTFLTVNLLFLVGLPIFISHLVASIPKIFMVFGMNSPQIAYTPFVYGRKVEGIGEPVILREENRRALAREAEKNGLYNKTWVGSQRRFQRFASKFPSDDFTHRLLQSFLDVVIASFLTSSKEITGYDIVLRLHQKYGILYSPGTIYPILHGMEKTELIKSKISGHRRPYVLTEKGKRWYTTISKKFPEVLKILTVA